MSDALNVVQKYFPSVTKVTDGDDDMTLEVTKSDSTDGVLKDHAHCAFARACQRKFKARGVIVSIHTCYVIIKEGALRYHLPEAVSREIVSFDRKGGFAEGEYRLIAPRKSHRLGAQQGSNKGQHGAETGKKRTRPHHITTGIRAMLRGGEVL